MRRTETSAPTFASSRIPVMSDLDKQFENRRPVSWYALSKGGRAALKKHLQALEVLISQSSV